MQYVLLKPDKTSRVKSRPSQVARSITIAYRHSDTSDTADTPTLEYKLYLLEIIAAILKDVADKLNALHLVLLSSTYGLFDKKSKHRGIFNGRIKYLKFF